MEIFSGTLILDDGARVPVELGLDDENLTVRTEGRQIGTWPIKYCRVSPSSRGAVMLSLDGEKAAFEPSDVASFSTAAAQAFRASSLSDRINVIRNLPPSADSGDVRTRGDRSWLSFSRRWIALGLGVVGLFALAVVVLAVVSPEDDAPTSGSTLPGQIVTGSAPFLFDQTVDRFVEEWNLNATTFGVPVQIRGTLEPGVFESVLTASLTLQGRTDSDGTVQSLVLVIDPAGETEDDQVALSALGVAIAVANPELDREGRAAVLADMGLDVRNPDLAGVNGETEVGAVRYTLTYYPEFAALLFTVEPA